MLFVNEAAIYVTPILWVLAVILFLKTSKKPLKIAATVFLVYGIVAMLGSAKLSVSFTGPFGAEIDYGPFGGTAKALLNNWLILVVAVVFVAAIVLHWAARTKPLKTAGTVSVLCVAVYVCLVMLLILIYSLT